MSNGNGQTQATSSTTEDRLGLEISTLGSFLLHPDDRMEILTQLTPGMFSSSKCRTLFERASEMVISGEHCDLITLRARLREKAELERAGGNDFLASLAETPCIYKGLDYADRLKKASLKDRLLKALSSTYKDLNAGEVELLDPSKLYDRISKAAGLSGMEKQLWWMSDLMNGLDIESHRIGATSKDVPSTRIPELDRKISLFRPSSFTVIAARPGIGKSTLMRQLALSASMSGPALIFSFEESREQVRDKMLTSMARVNYWNWFNGFARQEDEEKLALCASDLADKPIAIYGGYNADATKVVLMLRMLQEKGQKPVACFVDHLNLMKHPKAESRDEAVGETTRILRLASLEFEVPIILLCQMNRDSEKRSGDDRRPKLSDLRESGNIEANAPNVMFLWREHQDMPNLITLTIAKHRDGPTAEFEMVFLKEYGRFEMATSQSGAA